MRTKWFKPALSLLALAALSCTAARAQTDVAGSLYGAFSGSTTSSNGNYESPSDSAGGIIELRHVSNPLVGYEATYSYNRANQVYSNAGFCSLCTGPPPEIVVSANADEFTGDWLLSARAANFRPFALAGVGILLTEPTSGQSGTQGSHTAVYVYGAGFDWGVLPHVGLRVQYRGNVNKAPCITTEAGCPDAFKHTAEPMIGAYFQF
jgi:opacity protein-like surface antigen